MTSEIQHMQGMTPHPQMVFLKEFRSRQKSKGTAYVLACYWGLSALTAFTWARSATAS